MAECKKCLLDDSKPGIRLDQYGVCNYCAWQDKMEKKNKIHEDNDITEAMGMFKSVNGDKYDCIIGISGGVDSSYLLAKAVLEWGLNPLAVTFDDGWNTKIATSNIRRIVDRLGVDLYSYVVESDEMDDIYKSFINARVVDTDAPTDIAIAKTLRIAAKKYKIRYIVDAHNFRTEGTMPLGWLYFDGKYVESVHDIFGSLAWSAENPNGGGFPNLRMRDMVWDTTKKIRPLYNMKYTRHDATEYLIKIVDGWEGYNEHHGENLWTKFSNYVWMPKFGIDLREVFLSAQIRSGIIKRDDAKKILDTKPDTRRISSEVEHRLNINIPETLDWHRTYKNFDTYEKSFKKYKPVFNIMKRLGLVNETFYQKYCEGI